MRIPTAHGTLSGALALPERTDAASPGVIVLHELFGLNEDMRRISRRFADHGYAALAPDLYSVGPRLKPICIWQTMNDLRVGNGRAFELIEACRAWLAERTEVDASRMAVAGFCLGGGFALLHAARAPLGAAAVFYGRVPPEDGALEGICPVVASYGENDRVFVRQADRLRRRLEDLGVEHEITVYPQAGHSFMSRYQGLQGFLVEHSRRAVGYHHESAEAAWTTMLDFFQRHLDGTTETIRT